MLAPLSIESMANRFQMYQNQRSVIESIPSIYVHACSNLLMTHFEITLTTCLAQQEEWFTGIEGVVLLQAAGRNLLMFGVKSRFDLILAQNSRLPFRHSQCLRVNRLTRNGYTEKSRTIRNLEWRINYDLVTSDDRRIRAIIACQYD